MRDELAHVYWLGGGSGAGKSTIARRIATQHGLHLYATDDVMGDHARRSSAEESPFLARFIAMDMDQRWVNRSPVTMLETFHWFRGEGFRLIVEDLLALPKRPPVIAEGFRLLPHLVQPVLADPRRAIWLIPTPEVRHAAFEARHSSQAIAERTNDPDRALHNLLERDRIFTDRLRRETQRVGLSIINVDIEMTEDELAEQVSHAFGL